MKKVLAIFMAIVMVATMFAFSVSSFAEEVEEKASVSKFLGTASSTNLGLMYDRKSKQVIVDENQGSSSKPWNLHVFNPETAITDNKIAPTNPTVGTLIIDKINDYAASGEYSEVNIVLTASAEEAVMFYGLKGTAEAPIVIISEEGTTKKSIKNTASDAPAITLVDCEYVTVKNVAVSALNNGIVLDDCANVAVEGVDFSQIGYVDYLTPVVDEEGNESINAMETAALVEKGSSLLVGGDCADITVTACTFEKCRAGVVIDSTVVEKEEDADAPAEASEETEADAKGVAIVDCTFDGMNEAAVVANGGEDITVSGGSVTASGDVINADGYDGTSAAAFVLDGAKNVTIERVFSTDNTALIEAYDATGRVRYNVSDRDGSSFVAASDLLIYNNTFVAAASSDFDAVVRNNIFQMNLGEKVVVENGGSNCYHWTSKGDRNSIRKNPRFANAFDGSIEGTSVKDNYILASGSPCIGAGEKVEDDMGTADFYGNAIGESYNIGAYAGEGADATVEIVSDFVDFFNYIFAVIKNFFENLFA